MSEKPTLDGTLDQLEAGLYLIRSEVRVLLDAIRKMQQRIRALEKDLEFSRAGYDTVDCTPKEAQPDEEDPNTVSG